MPHPSTTFNAVETSGTRKRDLCDAVNQQGSIKRRSMRDSRDLKGALRVRLVAFEGRSGSSSSSDTSPGNFSRFLSAGDSERQAKFLEQLEIISLRSVHVGKENRPRKVTKCEQARDLSSAATVEEHPFSESSYIEVSTTGTTTRKSYDHHVSSSLFPQQRSRPQWLAMDSDCIMTENVEGFGDHTDAPRRFDAKPTQDEELTTSGDADIGDQSPSSRQSRSDCIEIWTAQVSDDHQACLGQSMSSPDENNHSRNNAVVVTGEPHVNSTIGMTEMEVCTPKRLSSAVSELASLTPFTPCRIDPNRCMARTWGGGLGSQCSARVRRAGGRTDLCVAHAKHTAHGRVDGPVPFAKLEEFRRAARIKSEGEKKSEQHHV